MAGVVTLVDGILLVWIGVVFASDVQNASGSGRLMGPKEIRLAKCLSAIFSLIGGMVIGAAIGL